MRQDQLGTLPPRWARATEGLTGRPARWSMNAATGLLALYLFTHILFPAPLSVLFLGAVLGSLSALTALGLVLVYRANRVINFAQGEIGAVAGLLGVLLIASGWPYLPSLLAGLMAAVVLVAVIEMLIIRRFSRAPRLILTVVTIGLAQLLSGVELALPAAFGQRFAPQNFPTPFEFSFVWHPIVFRGNHLLAVLVVIGAVVALAAFFRFTRVGIAVRAAAESSDRAEELGIPTRRINLLVWILAGALSATGSLLQAPLVGVPIGQVMGPALLLRGLAAAVIGRMENLRVTFAAAVVLGVMEQAVFWHTGRTIAADAVLFVIIIGALLLQPRGAPVRGEGTSNWDLVREVRPIPPEMRALPEVRLGFPLLGLAAVAIAVVVPVFLRPSRVNLLGSGVILAIVGLSLVVLTGWAGEVSLGQMALFGIGSAVAVRLAHIGWNVFAVLVAAAIVGALVSIAIGLPALRIRGPFLAVATLGFGLAGSSFFLNRDYFGWLINDERLSRPLVFSRFDLDTDHTFYYFLLIVFAGVLISLRSIRHSRVGRVLVATRANPRAAQAYGVSVLRTRLTAFALAGLYAALAGGLFGFHQRGLAYSRFLPEESIRVFMIVVFGGLGSAAGVVAGAAYFTTIDYFFPLAQTRFLISGVGLLLVMLFLRGGLGGLLYDLRDAYLRRVAKRRGMVVPSLLADVRIPDALGTVPASGS